MRFTVQPAANAVRRHTVRLRGRTFNLTIAGANEDAGASGDLDILGKVTPQFKAAYIIAHNLGPRQNLSETSRSKTLSGAGRKR